MGKKKSFRQISKEIIALIEELNKRRDRFAISRVVPGSRSKEDCVGNVSACDIETCDPPDPDDPPPEDTIGNVSACTIDCCTEISQ